MCQAVTTVREQFSPQFPFSQKVQINDEYLFGNAESWQSLSLSDTSDLVQEDCFVADAVRQASRNPIATSYHESRCLFQFPARKSTSELSIEQLSPC